MVLFAVPMFLLVNTASPVLIVIAIVIAYAVCQNSLAGAQGPWFPELFHAETRASGASIAYQFAAVVSGFTPFVVTLLQVGNAAIAEYDLGERAGEGCLNFQAWTSERIKDGATDTEVLVTSKRAVKAATAVWWLGP